LERTIDPWRAANSKDFEGQHVGMAEVVTIGNQSDSTTTAFGDDCKYHSTNAFSYAIFENTGVGAARELLFAIKQEHELPDGVPHSHGGGS
jgi:hypothetical protein